MAFNVSEFNGKLSKYGLAKDNLFLVQITPPSLDSEMPVDDLQFFCSSASLPSLTFEMAQVKRQGYGMTDKRPVGLPFDNLNTVFMIDSTFRVKTFFHNWMQSIVNFDNSRGYNFEYNNMLPFEVAYHEKYAGTVQIGVYSFHGEELKYLYKFGNAFPVSVGDITTSWSSNDTFMTAPIQFAYDTYQVQGFGESVKSSRINSSRGFGGGGVDGFITRLGNFGQALDAIGVNTGIQDIVNQYSSVSSRLNGALQIPQALRF